MNHYRRRHLVTLLLLGAALPWCAMCNRGPSPLSRTGPPAHLDAKDDPLNRYVESATVDGLIVSVKIDARTIALNSAQAARIPRPRPSLPASDTETVRLTLLHAGSAVQTVVVRDPAVLIEENGPGRRLDTRTVNVALATPRPVDTLEVRANAGTTSARFDLSSIMREACRGRTNAPACAQQ